jgi:predicted HicB family RNase H-like nuclease
MADEKDVSIHVRVSPILASAAATIARREQISLSAVVRRAFVREAEAEGLLPEVPHRAA